MKTIVGFLCMLVASVVSAQTLVLGNTSPLRQVRWSTAIVPNAIVETWPDQGAINGRIYVKGNKTRLAGTNVYVLADIPGNAVVPLWGEPLAIDLPRPIAGSLLNSMFAAPMILKVGNDEAALELDELQIESQWRVRGLFSARAGGVVARVAVDAYAWQDSVDLSGFVVFSDRNTQALESAISGIDISIEVPVGAVHLYYESRWGQAGSGTREFFPFNDLRKLPDGMAFPFYGVYQPDIPPQLPANDWLGSPEWRQIRIDAKQGAQHGPVTADLPAYGRQGHWFGLGEFHTIPQPPTHVVQGQWNSFQNWLQGSGSVVDQKEYASPMATGQSGTHKPMGIFKSVELLQYGDPRFIHRLRQSTADHFLRGWHHYEPNLTILTEANHPGWRTWSSVTHFTSSDTLGKPGSQPWGWGLGRAYADDQHWVASYVHANRAVADTPYEAMLEISGRHYLETTKARAFRRLNRVDSPRAGARLLKNWAWEFWNTNSADTRQIALDLSREEVDKWWARTEMHPGPLKPGNVQGPDSRVLENHMSIVPWQEALLCGGAALQAATFAGVDQAHADKAHNLAVRLGETIALGGLIRETSTGVLYPLTGAKWIEGGYLNHPSYYTFPRAGAGFRSQPPVDALIGTLGWHTGMGQPSCYQYTRQHTTDPNVAAILDEVFGNIGPATAPGQAEWRLR